MEILNSLRFPLRPSPYSKPLTLLLSLILLLTQISCKCTPNTQIEDLWSGTIDFTLPQVTSNTMAFTFSTYTLPTPRPYTSNSNLQYAFALKDMSTQTGNLIYWDMLALKTYQSNIVINFIYEPNKWNKIVFNYWMSFRYDLVMGIQSFNFRSFKEYADGKGVIESRVDVMNGTLCEDNIVIIFLVGLKYSTKNGSNFDKHRFSCTITEQTINNKVLTIKFSTKSHLPIEAITFSYLVFAPSHANFGSYGGIISQPNFKGSYNQDLSYLFPNYNFHAIFGLSCLEAKQDSNEKINYHSGINAYYLFQFGVKEWQLIDNIQVSYVVAGVRPAEICAGTCLAEGKSFVFRNQCVSSCPADTKIVEYIDKGKECKGCPLNEHFEGDKCTCDFGFKRNIETGKCDPLISNAVNQNTDVLGGSVTIKERKMDKNCLKMVDIQQSNRNLFVTFSGSPQVLSDRRSKQDGFLSITFPDLTVPVSYYCNKCQKDPSIFECLLLFASGLPRSMFKMQVECTVQGIGVCQLSVPYQSVKKRQ